jgi:hypothetical protein
MAPQTRSLVFKPLAVDPANRNTALLMFGEFVLTLSLEPLLPETKCIATKALLDAFPTDAATKAQLGNRSRSGDQQRGCVTACEGRT